MTKTDAKHATEKGMRLNMELGIQMGVELQEVGQSFKAVLTGLEPDQFLLLKIALPKEFRDMLKKDSKVKIRYLSLGTEFGFTTKIIENIDTPFRLLFISYPNKVDSLDTRARTRVCCYIPSTATMNNNNIKGTITDISKNGCRFVIKLPVNLQPRQIMLVDDIQLCFPVMGIKGLQIFDGQVRNTMIDKEKIAMGVEFMGLREELQISISEYITSVAEISSIDAFKF